MTSLHASKNIDLSILIINWNTKDLLENCLESILENVKNIAYEVIIADNNSSDDSASFVKQYFPHLTLLVNNKNIGGLANIRALPYCQGKYVLLLGPDTVVLPGAVERMVGFLNTHDEAGAVSAYLLYPNGRFQRYYNSFPNVFFNLTLLGRLIDKIILHRRYFREYYAQGIDFSKIVLVDQPCGACFMIRREVITEIGGIVDNDFVCVRALWFNDVSLCRRIYEHGHKIFVLPKARIIHFKHSSFKKADKLFQSKEYTLGLLTYVRKYEKSKITRLIFYLERIFLSLLTDARHVITQKNYDGHTSYMLKIVLGLNDLQQ